MNTDSANIAFTNLELKVITSVLKETISQIEDWEFQTLIGFSKKDTLSLMKWLEET